MSIPILYELRCRECGKTWGNVPRSFCEDCFSPLEVAYDYDALKKIARRENLARRDFNMWRYAELLPLPEDFTGPNAVGGTPLVASRKLASRWGLKNLYFKNDAVCFPSLSFKDRVVATALSAARRFGFETVGCSSTGNLANAVAAQAAQQGFDACVFIPADLEPAKVLNTAVYGARIVRINGNHEHVHRLCAQIADRFQWGLVNVNLRPYYSEGSKTHGYEIAEQLGWTLPDNVVVPMADGSLITKIAKAFRELVALGWVEAKPVQFFGAQPTGCSPISDGAKRNLSRFEPQKPNTIAGSLAVTAAGVTAEIEPDKQNLAMSVTIELPTVFRRVTDVTPTGSCSAVIIAHFLVELISRLPALLRYVRDEHGRIRPFLNVYLNEE